MNRDVSGFGVVALFTLLVGGSAFAQSTTRVSVDAGGNQGNGLSNGPSISADGRYVTFYSDASNFVAGDTNGVRDCFLYDRLASTIVRVSVDSGGLQGNASSGGPMISADGRWVVYHSDASNLVAGDTNAARDVFLWDRLSGATTCISVDSSGIPGNGASSGPSISSDGHFIAFYSDASNLVPGDTNAVRDIFLRDTVAGTTIRISLDSNGVQGNAGSQACVISSDGRYVAYPSDATNLVAGDTNAVRDVFRYDQITATTILVSVDSAGVQGNGISNIIETVGVTPNTSPINGVSTISTDGRYVAFYSSATNLVPGDTNAKRDVFVRDVQLNTTVRVSVDSNGAQGNEDSASPNTTPDGRYIAFYSDATNLVAGDTNAARDVFIYDMQTGSTVRVSVDSNGNEANARCSFHAISADGRFMSFSADATNLVPGDTNTFQDVFVRDLRGSGFTILCDPGVNGILACPCSNPPSGSGRGCNNKAATGGAFITTGSGLNSLSTPTLVFTTAGENLTAFSIMIQGGVLTTGVAFGHGVRCMTSFKRMYKKSAVGGSTTMPNLPGGDLTIPARSSAAGDTILAGQKRVYQVYYRDTTLLLPGCPLASNQFNVTNAVEVTWLP